MDQVYRIGRRLGKLMLALLMFVSLFDLTSLFANDETNAPAKVIQLCDEENIQSTEDGELLIPWSSTIETTDENMLLYNDYENTMQDNLYATPDTLNLQIVDHTGGKQIELVEGTDYELYYTNPSDGLFTMNKEDAAQFTHFKIMFTDKTKTFSNMMIKYNTHAKIADVKENEQERKFLNEATFKIKTDYWITETATYTYTNPNFKPVENSMNAQENVNAIYAPREFTWEDDTVKIKASVTQRDIPDNAVMKAERVTESADKENNIITEILDQASGTKYYYQVTFTSNDEVVAIDQSKIKFESSVKPSVKSKLQYRSARSTAYDESGDDPDTSVGNYPNNYKVWRTDENRNHNQEYKFGDFGEQYNLFYILGNYNVFTFNYYYGTHGVGPMMVGGEAAKQSANGNGEAAIGDGKLNIGGTTTRVDSPHNAPTYIKGNANIVNTIQTDSNVPFFVGKTNSTSKYTIQDIDDKNYYNYYYSDNYVDFNKAEAEIDSQLSQLAKFEGYDTNGKFVEKVNINADDLVVGKKSDSYEVVSSNEEQFKTVLKIKLGYNYVFDKGAFEKIDAIIYDYESLNEATQTTTFINVPDDYTTSEAAYGGLHMPYIFKSKSDALGSTEAVTDIGAYQFASSEVEKGINIAYFMPNAQQIKIGFNKAGETSGLNKLVGHLVAPKANVDIRSGDYNGSIIAKQVSSTAEGHMWPFKTDLSFGFNKLVDGRMPNDDETFYFKLETICSPDGASTNVSSKTVKSDEVGNINFDMNLYTKEGIYKYKVSEVYQNTNEYEENSQSFYILVDVIKNSSDVGYGQLKAEVTGYYRNVECTDQIDLSQGSEALTFKNTRKTSVKVNKEWFDTDGNTALDESHKKPIQVQLKQHSSIREGYKIKYKVYYKNQLIKELNTETPPIKAASQLKASTNHDKDSSDYYYLDDIVVLGNSDFSLDHSNYEKSLQNTSKYNGVDINLINIQSDTTVKIYYGCSNPAGLDLDKNNIKLEYGKSNDFTTETKGEIVNYGNLIDLNSENSWTHTFENLPVSKFENGKNYSYTYSIEEINSLDNFNTEYNNNDGILSGIITVKNILKPVDLTIQKKSSTGNSNYLGNATFNVYKYSDIQNGAPLKFNEINGGYQLSDSGEVDLVTPTTGDRQGLIKIVDMPYGDYVFEETNAPSGFVVDNKYIYVHIDYEPSNSYYQLMGNSKVPNENMNRVKLDLTEADTSKIQLKFAVENTPNIDVPETGGTPNDRYQKLGFLLACTGLAMYAIYEVKRKKNKEKSTN